ncbi:MAG: N-acetylgalactosamine-6-sulfatase, partial [Planctomycetaceae bacterium]
PTFCEVAGAKLPEGYVSDGVSQVQVLKGKPAPRRLKPLFWKYPSRWPAPKNRPDHWVSYAVVHEKWKLVSNKSGTHVELYDIAASPFEERSVAPANPTVVAALTAKLEQWKVTLPDKPTGNVFSDERKKLAK